MQTEEHEIRQAEKNSIRMKIFLYDKSYLHFDHGRNFQIVSRCLFLLVPVSNEYLAWRLLAVQQGSNEVLVAFT